MKINCLRFKNINSLAGEQLIDFQNGPLSQSSIFAIVGPTGSGKSTLLDVITLALYGKVPRLGSVSNTSVEQEGSIVTHHQSEAFAEVTYQTASGNYISSWSIRKTRTGRWQAPKMEIALDKEVLESSKSKVPAKNELLIGLTYDQFVKAIVLSQGQFAAFLQAKRDDRAKLLEDITGAKIYRQIGREVYRRYQIVKEKLQQQENRLQDIAVLEEEARKQKEADLKEAENAAKSFDHKLGKWSAVLTAKTAVKRLVEELEQVLLGRGDHEKEVAAASQDRVQLQQHEKVSGLAPAFSEYRSMLDQLDKQRAKKEQLSKKLQDSNNDLHTIHYELENTLSEDIDKGQLQQRVQEMVNAATTIKAEQDQVKREGLALRSELDAAIASENLPICRELEQLKKPADILQVVERARQAYPKPEQDSSIQELTQSKDKSASDRTDIKEVISQRRLLEDNEQQHKSYTETIKQLKQEGDRFAKDLATTNKAARKATDILADLQEQKLAHSAIQSLEDRREDLEDGEPCPLCGSTEHPYKVHQALHKYLEIDQAIEKAKADQQAAQTNLLETQKKLSQVQSDLKSQGDNLVRLEQQVTDRKRELEQHLTSHPEWAELNLEALKALDQQLIQRISTLNAQIEALELHRYLDTIDKNAHRLRTSTEQYLEKQDQLKEVTGGQSLEDDLKPMLEKVQQLQASKAALDRQLEEIDIELTTAENEAQKKQDDLSQQASKLGYGGYEEAVKYLLPDDGVKSLRMKLDALDKRAVELKTQHKTLNGELDKAQKEDVQKEVSLDAVQQKVGEFKQASSELQITIGQLQQELKADQSRRKQLQAVLDDIEVLQDQSARWLALNDMIGDATGNKFSRIAQDLTLRNLIALANRRLDALTDRYLIDMPDGSDYLRVVDRYQGDSTRSVITLSGGETFLLSLAMALSLSDMASQSVDLKSLFIDEGFGTLDQDTLELALSTLERLQAQSEKTIGIISHVAALKERIATQVVLTKSDTGVSTIDIVA